MADVGRPLAFTSVEELDAKINGYFVSLGENEPATMTGLAIALDVDRKTILNYSEKLEYFPSIARAKARCEVYAEKQLFIGRNPSGAQFALTNNYDSWENKSKQDTTLKGDKENPVEVHHTGLIGETISRILDK